MGKYGSELSPYELRARKVFLIRIIILFCGIPLLVLPIYWLSNVDLGPSNHFQKALSRLRRSNDNIVQIPAGFPPNFSGDYMIRYYYTDPTYFKKWYYDDVTIATQCSANHLHHVVELSERWSGPLSVAVFAPNKDASFATDA